MSLSLLAVLVIAFLAGGYLLYGSFIARQYRLDDSRPTPAVEKSDGVDFIPTRPFYLMSQHFSAIAAAGPIVGPIAACMAFGWVPCVLWIGLGVILIGAVHDFSALVASVRHGAHSVCEVAREHLGRRAWVAMVAFIWLALVYVIVAFTDVTAGTFVGTDPEVAGLSGEFNRGGAVAAASTMYLLLALVMGLVQKWLSPPVWVMTLIFVPGTLGVIWLGTQVSTVLVFPAFTWQVAILVYCFAASLLPVWVLQQSRGYLGGFVLYLAIGVGVLGILFGGFSIQQPAFAPTIGKLGDWLAAPDPSSMTDLVFPFLFVTIACGACSGFHGLVCGGTTSKQVSKESHCKPIGFGAMLLEGFVAVIALSTVMIVAPSAELRAAKPGEIYGDGIAQFITVFLGRDTLTFAKTFGTMAVATFVFDTLDVATRLGRYLLQELTGRRSRWAGALAAGATAGVPLLVLWSVQFQPKLAPGQAPITWRTFWTLFGTSNQLLAGLTLLGVTVWLARSGKRYWYTLLPMVFIMTITVCALLLQIIAGARVATTGGALSNPAVLNGAVGVALLALAAMFVVEAWRSMAAHRRARAAVA